VRAAGKGFFQKTALYDVSNLAGKKRLSTFEIFHVQNFRIYLNKKGHSNGVTNSRYGD